MIVFFDHLLETMEEDWSLNCNLHCLMVFFIALNGVCICLGYAFGWGSSDGGWDTTTGFGSCSDINDGVWVEVGVGWEVSWTVGCQLVGPVGCI